MRSFIFISILFCLPNLCFAQIYECKINGRSTFQNQSCVGKTAVNAQAPLSQKIKTIKDLANIRLASYNLSLNECKAEISTLQKLAVKQAFKTLVLENSTTNYMVKVCMPPNSSILIVCDGMKHKMFLRRRAPCS